MEAVLNKLNESLREAYHLLEGEHAQERLEKLQSGDNLPDRKLLELANSAVDLSDKLQRMLQPPSLTLAESFLSYIDTKCLWAAVSNDIPDKISAGTTHLPTLAQTAGLKPAALRSILCILVNNGIFQHDPRTDSYHHTPASRLLTKDHWTQWHNWTDLYGNEFYDICRALPQALRADEPRAASQIEFQTDERLFEYLQARGLAGKFHRTLGRAAIAQAPGIVADYDWGAMSGAVVLDVGGGAGDFLAALLRAHPAMRGALLELESVVELAKEGIRGPEAKYADVEDRVVELHVGDFTQGVPAYEMYVMKWCLHNWDDDMVVRILGNVRRAIKETPSSRFVIVEGVLAPGRSCRVSRYADITMMIAVNGLERTREDWASLAEKGGWRIEGISSLRNAWCCAIDLRPV